jgi:HNH endonuclease
MTPRYVHAPLIPNKLTLNIQWVNKGYSSRISDPAPLHDLGGPTKIDSIQNVILLRSDLHDAWDNYKFAVNPDVCIFPLFPISVLNIHSNSAGM